MLDSQINSLCRILSDEDLQTYANDGFWNLMQTVILSDPFAGVETIRNVKELIFHMPTLLFWDKMKRFLYGTFRCFNDQVKMSQKFSNDNSKYTQYVKKLLFVISEIEDDKKIDYFAALTRSFLLTNLDETLYFKLSKFLCICTVAELEFIENCEYNFKCFNSAMVSSLSQYGLMTYYKDNYEVWYVFSDFAKALKCNSLNTCETIGSRFHSYEEIAPINSAELVSSGIYSELGKAYRDGVNSAYDME